MLRLSLNNAKGEMMSRKIMLSMLLLFSVFALSAVTLDGIVTGAESGEALPGADVELHFGGMEFYETSTDESGEFIFDEVEAGNYFLRVEAAGFVPYMEMLELNENMTITIALLPGNIPGELTGHLFGNVIYEEGEPAAGLEVHIGAFVPGMQPPHVNYLTVTDEAGNYEFIEILDFITYNLMIPQSGQPFMAEVAVEGETEFDIVLGNSGGGGELTGHLFGIISQENGEPAENLPVVISTWNQNAQPHHVNYETFTGEDGSYEFNEIIDNADYELSVLTLPAPYQTEVHVAGETEFDIILEGYEPGETYSLSGTVSDSETGEALSGIAVVLHSGMPGYVLQATSDEAGYYVFEAVYEGFYELAVPGWGSGYQTFNAEIEIVEDTMFDIALVPYEQGELSLSGVVTDAESGEMLPGIMINLHAGPGMHYETESQEDGSYLIEGLFAAEYFMTAISENPEYLPYHTELEIEEDTEYDIEMQTIQTGELTLSGTVTAEESGAPLPGIMVHLWADNIPGNMFAGITNDEGYYEITGIFPGEYEVVVMGMQGMVIYSDEIEILETMVYDIVIGENPGEEGNLSGVVINSETGEFVAGAQILLQHGWQVFETVSGEAGMYAFDNIPIQNYQLIAGAEGYHQFNAPVMVEEETVFEIALEPFPMGDYSLSGLVTDAETGDFLPGVHIQLFAEQGINYNVFTDESGHYEINGIFEGTYQIMAWIMNWGMYEPFEATIEIYENTLFDFALQPLEMPGTGSIIGTVIDAESSEPIAEAFLHIAPVEGGGHWNYYETLSDESGSFEFAAVQEGEYILAAGAEGFVFSFYDGVTNPEEATVLEVIEGEELVIEMALTPLVFYNVSGNVSDYMSGTALEEAFVRALMPGTGCNHWAVAETVTDSDGNFVMEIPQGEYIFAAEYGEPNTVDFMRQFYDHKQTPVNADIVTVNVDIAGIDFELAAPEHYENRISGTITVEGTIPANPVLVAAVSGENQWEAATVTDMFGNYVLNNLPEGEFYLLAYEYNSVPTYYPGVIDFEEAEVVMAQGNVTGIDFELILPQSNGVYQADGYVLNADNQPVANANVIITNEYGEVLSYAVTNSEGYYQANGLPSGALTGLATKVLYNSDQETINVTTTGSADFVITPQTTTDENDEEVTPAAYTLGNYPNPFNPTTTISFSLPENEFVTLAVYNVSGQKIASLVQDYLSSGIHNITWNGTTDSGEQVSSGIYFYKLQGSEFARTRKMILMK